jgi:outer membrane protein TolC
MWKPHVVLLTLGLAASTGAAPEAAPPENQPPPSPAPATPAVPEPPATAESLERILAARPVINQPLTLDQAVTIALRESPVVRGAVAEVEAAEGRLSAARAETRPWVSANAFLSGGSNASIVSTPPVSQPQMIMGLPRGAFADANLMLMFPLITSGRLQAMVRQAAALREASEAELEARRQEVALMTRTAYREVLARRALVAVWQARLREDEERLRVDRARLQQQQIPSFYVLRDEAELAATRQELTNAQRDQELSLLQLRTVMGISPVSRIEVVGSLDAEPSSELLQRLTGESGGQGRGGVAPTFRSAKTPGGSPALQPSPPEAFPPDLVPLLRLAEQQRPELRAAGQRVRGAAAETAAIRSSYGPQVNLAAMGDLMKMKGEDPFAGVTYGVVASLPLYNGGQRRARVQAAAAERRREEQERERVALQVAQEVTAALLNLRAAEQNVETARAALTAAQEDYRVALLRYQSGRGIAVEALDALAARVRAEGNVVQALFQYNVARDQLLRAVGDTARPIKS